MGLWLCQYGFFNQLSTLMESRMHVEEDGHPYALLVASCVFEAMELFTRNHRESMFISCSYWSRTAVLAGGKSWRMLSIFIIDFFIHFSVSRSTPPSCGFLCPWHIVRVDLSLPRPQPLSPPITPLAALYSHLRKLSCKIILSVQAGL